MAKNRAQCQEGLSFPDFQKQSGTEAQCRKTVFRHRWPQGLRCPACDTDRFCLVSVGRYQCPACCHQTSFSAGMICAGTKFPPWFLATCLLTTSRNAMSALELKRQLGVSHHAASLLKQKILLAFVANAGSDTLTRYSYNPGTGALTSTGFSAPTGTYPDSVAVAP